MSTIVSFPITLESDLGHELTVDCARFAEGILTEAQVRKKYRFDEAAWVALGANDELIEKVEAEKLRRVRDGSTKREKSQQLIVKAPDILDSIASDVSASPRHRVDAIKTLDGLTAGPAAAAASDRFVITINLGADVLKFDKSIAVDPNDIDPNHPEPPTIVAIAAKKTPGGGSGEPV